MSHLDESEDEFVDSEDEFVDDDEPAVPTKPSKTRGSKHRAIDPESRKRRLEQHEALKKGTPSNAQAIKQTRLGDGDVIDVETKAECRKREKQEQAARFETRKQHDQRQKLCIQLGDVWCRISGAESVDELNSVERVRLNAMINFLTSQPPFAGSCSRNVDHEQLKALGAKFDRASKTWHAPDHETLLRLLEEMPAWSLSDLPSALHTNESQHNLRDLCKHSQRLFYSTQPSEATEQTKQTVSFPNFSPRTWFNELPAAAPAYHALLKTLQQQFAGKPIDIDTEQDAQLLDEYGLPPEAPLFFYKVKSVFGPRKTNSMASRLVRALHKKKTTVTALKEAWLDVRSGRVSYEEVLARIQVQSATPP